MRETLSNLKHKIKLKYVKFTFHIVKMMDGIRDVWFCGSLLTRVRAVNVEGATGYEPTSYCALETIFEDAEFAKEDSFVDIGCGEGRVMAWLIHKRFQGKITGIEMDFEAVDKAKNWMKRYPNAKVRLIDGDAMEQSYNDYTIFYIFRPFNEEFFERFIQRLEMQLTHPIRFYYHTDLYCRKYLINRHGWKMIRRQMIWRKNGLYIYRFPQFYSIWMYTPTQNDIHLST